MIKTILAIIGTIWLIWLFGMTVAEILRSLYWAIWELVALRRHADEKPSARQIAFAIWRAFLDEMANDWRYETRCVYGIYSHGYWPWDGGEIYPAEG